LKELEPPNLFTLGLDVGGTKLLGVCLDGEGRVLEEVRLPTTGPAPTGSGNEVVTVVVEAVERLTDTLEQGSASVEGVGVGVPGLLQEGRLWFAPNLPSGQGVDFRAQLGRALAACGCAPGAALVVDNDATCALVGELELGVLAGELDAILVTLGTGIGGGILSGGEVLRGAHGWAGELGHVLVDPSGPMCTCGRRGCWERYASGSGLGRLAREAALAGRIPGVVAMAGGSPEGVQGEHVTWAAAAGDKGAKEVLGELAWWIAVGLANFAAALDPSLIVLGGGLVEAGEHLLEPVRKAFAELVPGGLLRSPVRIVAAGLGERAGAIGAAVEARSAPGMLVR
jgi:glucokinase